MSGTQAAPIGITNPPIDDLLTAADSKYALVIYSAKRARQINAYYSQLQEGLLDYVGPLVETEIHEKPMSIALREINEGLLTSSRPRPEGPAGLVQVPQMRVVLGVSGGIAAYKAASLLRLFTENGHDVTVVPTAAALQFVGAPTWSALSGKPVTTEVWTLGPRGPPRAHRPVGRPLRRRASDRRLPRQGLARPGRRPADNTLLTARCPVAFAPAMHTEMWEHPATQANVATLRHAARTSSSPPSGGSPARTPAPAASPSPSNCMRRAWPSSRARPLRPPTGRARDLAGLRVVVSAGGTREPLDPVRFLGNRSSGKQGRAIARAAADRGAKVTLVAANVSLPAPEGIRVVPVETTLELQRAVEQAAGTPTSWSWRRPRPTSARRP